MTTSLRRTVTQSSSGELSAYDDFAAPATGDWIKVRGAYTVQVTGAATAVTLQMQRSTRDPAGQAGANPAPLDAGTTGNPSTGMIPNSYIEDGCSWVRWVVSAMTGTPIHVSLAGKSWG